MRIESLCIVPMAAISNAMSSYTAQNIGAEREERVPQGYRAANWMVVVISVVLCLVLELFTGRSLRCSSTPRPRRRPSRPAKAI